MPGVEGQGADKEQQRQDGLKAPDVDGPPTVEEPNTQRTNEADHTENYSGKLTGPPTVFKEVMSQVLPMKKAIFNQFSVED